MSLSVNGYGQQTLLYQLMRQNASGSANGSASGNSSSTTTQSASASASASGDDLVVSAASSLTAMLNQLASDGATWAGGANSQGGSPAPAPSSESSSGASASTASTADDDLLQTLQADLQTLTSNYADDSPSVAASPATASQSNFGSALAAFVNDLQAVVSQYAGDSTAETSGSPTAAPATPYGHWAQPEWGDPPPATTANASATVSANAALGAAT